MRTRGRGHRSSRRLTLFESAFRDDFGPGSSVDLLVEFRLDARIGCLALSRMQRELSDLFHRKEPLFPIPDIWTTVRWVTTVRQRVAPVSAA